MAESVHMVWEIYDGPRSGIADLDGVPHYFECLFDEEKQDWSEKFDLKPISESLFENATEQWKIYRDWEEKYHSGNLSIDTHPGNRGVNPRYDWLEDNIKKELAKTNKSVSLFAAFHAADKQPDLPSGCVPTLEVKWQKET